MVAQSNGKTSFAMLACATGGEVIVPSDDDLAGANEFSKFSRAIYVGVGGDVTVITTDGSVLPYVGVASGTTLEVQAKQVLDTGTTAKKMLALW